MTAIAKTSADPLGPDSLTWKYFGDLRTGMMGIWIGAIQNMYPELGAGVEEHSVLLREPLQRVARSVYPIMGVVYDGERAAQTGQQIKGYHRTIKGVDGAGRRYHALNPDTFYWAHATFFMLIIKVAEYFCGGLTEAEKRQLFAEHVQWYRMYGMSMRPVPQSWEEFQEYWARVCREELEINQATLDIFKIRIPKPRFILMPTPIWDQLFKPLVYLPIRQNPQRAMFFLARTRAPGTGKSVIHDRRTTCLPKWMERSAYFMTAWKHGRYYRTYDAYVEDEVRAALDDPRKQFVRGPFGSSARGTATLLPGAPGYSSPLRPLYEVQIIASEPAGAAMLSGKPWAPHKIQGWTPDFVPKVLKREVAHRIVPVTDREAVESARSLARSEGIFCGISSGATFAAALKVALEAQQGAVILAMLPDTAERYLSTVLFEGIAEGSDPEP